MLEKDLTKEKSGESETTEGKKQPALEADKANQPRPDDEITMMKYESEHHQD